MWKYMAMMTKLKAKLRIEEVTYVLATEEEELSKQKLRQEIKAKENVMIFPSATSVRTGTGLGQFTENWFLKWRPE